MTFNLQPFLANEWVTLRPLKKEDFEALYKVASDPLIWEQHPIKTRYQKEVFQDYFKEAMESGGAFAVFDSKTSELIGSSRFYDYGEADSSIIIGYTFLARHCWGGKYNQSMKRLMLNHAFSFVDKVIFHVGETNIRSRKALEKTGAVLTGMSDKVYSGGIAVHCVYEISKQKWISQLQSGNQLL
ncbi:MAG TPA: GNAT family N-acetyltransferase [Chitinophagaceae bacterium]|nr:GNAT family N-acetyltransferase [Chitinophagaceae bacterium]